MRTKLITFLFAMWILFSSVFAQWNLEAFVVSVDPSTIKNWEPVNLIVKAIDADGNVIEDYEWDVIILVTNNNNSSIDDPNDYVLPNDWVYTFTKQDMWTKIFTKGLIINKEWDFKVRVEEFNNTDNTKVGEVDIKVVSKTWISTWKIEIITPQDGETINDSTITIVWNTKNYINSKIQVLVDDQKNAEWIIDSSWNYQVDLINLSNQTHTIKVEVLDLDGKVISTSNAIKLNVNAQQQLYKWIIISPEWILNKWTQVTITLKVDSSVSSATLHIANYPELPMNRKSVDEFTTELTANIIWTSNISADLTNSSWKKTFNNISKLVVVEQIAIQDVKFTRDNSKNTIDLNWKFTWQVPSFKVLYWTGSWKYSNENIVSENKYIIQNIDETKTYFVKIIPVDSNGNKIWQESNEMAIEANMKKSATCNIDNIKTKVVIDKWNHYLTWDNAEWALKYVIFEWKNSQDLSQIAELTWTKYQLPFDVNAKKDEYAYFTVKAVCDDGTMKQIGDVKKVKVWPMDWLLYAALITIVFYGLKLAIKEN